MNLMHESVKTTDSIYAPMISSMSGIGLQIYLILHPQYSIARLKSFLKGLKKKTLLMS